jgi:hypothetical protein
VNAAAGRGVGSPGFRRDPPDRRPLVSEFLQSSRSTLWFNPAASVWAAGGEWGIDMFHFCRRGSIAVFAFSLAVVASPANAFELSGVWSTDAEVCDKVFVRKGNQVNFAEMSDLYGSGFVIDGKQIQGKAARCTIESTKQDGDSLKLSAACATSIMTQKFEFQVKFVDNDNLVRSFPDIPGMSVRYYRCKI